MYVLIKKNKKNYQMHIIMMNRWIKGWMYVLIKKNNEKLLNAYNHDEWINHMY